MRRTPLEIELSNPSTHMVDVLAYCLMPTHYHILIRQNVAGGISGFLSKVQNSFTRYYNVRFRRTGSVFVAKFKSKPIDSEDLLKHVSRYIHLNPYSGGVVGAIQNIQQYPFSSFVEYIGSSPQTVICNTSPVLSLFDHNKERYRRFVLDNAEYQKTLELGKYSSR